MSEFLPYLAILIVLSLDLLLVATRSTYLQTSPARLLMLREQQDQRVNLALQIVGQVARLRTSLNLVLLVARFALAGLTLRILPIHSFLLGAIGLLAGALILFFCEYLVERGVSTGPETWALNLAGFSRFWLWITGASLATSTSLTPGHGHPEMPSAVTDEDIRLLVDAVKDGGAFEQGERRMIYSVFELRDTLVREIMVPRIDMIALEAQTPLLEAVDAILKYGHSRLPVYDEAVDQTLGLLYAKDLLKVFREGGQLSSLRELLRPAYFVPEAKKVDELLAEMQTQRIHMAIIVDEYGGVAGLVTMEDIVEEIVGEIQDEYDQGEEAPYQMLKDGVYVFQGRIDMDDFNEIMGSDLPTDEADTLGGYIYSVLGRVPTTGDIVRKDDLLLTVENVLARRIRKVRAAWLPSSIDEKKEMERVDG